MENTVTFTRLSLPLDQGGLKNLRVCLGKAKHQDMHPQSNNMKLQSILLTCDRIDLNKCIFQRAHF